LEENLIEINSSFPCEEIGSLKYWRRIVPPPSPPKKTEFQASKLRNKVFSVTFLCGNIQGELEGKVNVLGGNSIGNCERKVKGSYVKHCMVTKIDLLNIQI
jgi:hypothetical protein